MSEKLGNISSVVITLMPESNLDEIKEQIKQVASIEASQNDKVVALIESADTDGQIASFRALEAIKGVAHVDMIYSYEDPADADALATRSMDEIMDRLEKTPVEQIKYSGNIKI